MLKPTNLYEALKTAPIDPAVGIRVVQLTGEESFSLYGAEIAPRKRIAAHYHALGHETYQIMEGKGIMALGKWREEGVVWEEPFAVTVGDCFTVAEGQVHQLINTSDAPLLAVCGCARSHLTTDRTVVNGYGGVA
jgi:mannose-6-phosphate isomerase-like protein (cupin superfamily)